LGYLEKNQKTKKYRLSSKWLSIGYAFLNHFEFRKIALPHLKKLYEETSRTINLAINDDNEVLYIERISTSPLIAINIRPGLRRPLYPNAMGKAILAFLSDDERKAILTRIVSKMRIGKVKIERNRIERELAKIREVGHSESRITIGCEAIVAAVPIFNREGKAFGAMNIVLPINNDLNKKEFKRYTSLLMETGNHISSVLGYMENMNE